jgi:putative Holliday junction resolvase
MARILAVDFGEKRIGLATSDASGRLATPRVTLLRKSDAAVLAELARFCADEEISLAVFGIPRSPAGVESSIAGRIRSFAAKFEGKTGLPVRFHEETLTSDEAARRMRSAGEEGEGARRAGLDPAAAAVLLEDYLSSGGRGAL